MIKAISVTRICFTAIVMGIALTGLAAPTRAEVGIDVERELASCAGIVNRTTRLICYDDLSSKLGHVPEARAEREQAILEKYGFWEVTKRRNAAGEEVIYLKNDSIEQVTSQSGLQRNPTLIIKCRSGQTDVYLDWKAKLVPENLGGLHTLPISVQFDSGDRETVYWELSTDRSAIFAPSPVEFVKQLRQADKLVFYVTPTYDIAQTVVHDVSGLNAVLELLVAQCYK